MEDNLIIPRRDFSKLVEDIAFIKQAIICQQEKDERNREFEDWEKLSDEVWMSLENNE